MFFAKNIPNKHIRLPYGYVCLYISSTKVYDEFQENMSKYYIVTAFLAYPVPDFQMKQNWNNEEIAQWPQIIQFQVDFWRGTEALYRHLYQDPYQLLFRNHFIFRLLPWEHKMTLKYHTNVGISSSYT